MKFHDCFSSRSDVYSRFRPRYPAELFSFLASLTTRHGDAWDCATGNAQAAIGLAQHYNRVIATDASRQQIEKAAGTHSVHLCLALAEQPPLHDESIDLITVAQALHWLQHEMFFRQVKRVLKPGGVFAAWCYNLAKIDSQIDATILHLYSEILGTYWSPERKLLEDGYRSIAIPLDEIPSPELQMNWSWTLNELLGYLRSWSSAEKYYQKHQKDPIALIAQKLQNQWGDPSERKAIHWPLSFRIGRK